MKDLRIDYNKGALLESEIDKDPLLVFAKWFSDARDAGVQEANAFCLSTVAEDQRPSSRMLLLKDIQKDGYVFYSSYLSRKGKEIEQNPLGSMVFYWTDLARQIRIEGRIEKVSEKISDEYFYSRPRGAQISAAISRQSEVVEDREALIQEWKLNNEEPKQIIRPDSWGGYKLIPDYFEFWQGRQDRLHDRISFRKQNASWIISRLSP